MQSRLHWPRPSTWAPAGTVTLQVERAIDHTGMPAAPPAPQRVARVREPHRGRNPAEPMPIKAVALSDEQEYNWGVAGYLLLPAMFTPQQVREAAARADDGDFARLVDEASPLLPILARLCCSSDSPYDLGGIRVDVPPREISLGADATPPPLEGGTGKVGWVDQARSYFNTGGHRFVHGFFPVLYIKTNPISVCRICMQTSICTLHVYY